MFEPALRAELAIIEEFRGIAADRRMEPPSLFEEQTLVRADRPLAAQNVIEGRHIGAFRMAALHRVIELLDRRSAPPSSPPATPRAHWRATSARPHRQK